MEFKKWYQKRGFKFILKRGSALLDRYGFSSAKATARVEDCLTSLAKFGCSPTFFVPAVVVRRNLPFIHSLQDHGCEIGVHGYNHVDLKAYPPEDASRQLLRALNVLQSSGIEVHGFRCPYLSASDDLFGALPPGNFKYSSNKAVEWPYKRSRNSGAALLFNTIEKFYQPTNAEGFLCLPFEKNGLVELPACVPDDLQLHDGLGYPMDQITRAWLDTLHQTHKRGELFNLMFHPELAAYIEAPFISVLQEAQSLTPQVWVTRLREVSEWWQEREKFNVEIGLKQGGYTFQCHCTPRATLLYRGFDPQVQSKPWYENYRRAWTHVIPINGPRLPFIGLPSDAPDWVGPALRQMGYILLTGEEGLKCSLYLDKGCLALFDHPVELIAYIESLNVPMIRFWPWPDGMRSALCITGDLDALSLMDYATRLFVH